MSGSCDAHHGHDRPADTLADSGNYRLLHGPFDVLHIGVDSGKCSAAEVSVHFYRADAPVLRQLRGTHYWRRMPS